MLRMAAPVGAAGSLLMGRRRLPRFDVFFDFKSGLINPIIGGGSMSVTTSANGTYVNAAGLVVQNTANNPRFDYDPASLLIRGLLVEGQSTNLRPASFDMGDLTYWAPLNNGVKGTGIPGVTGSNTMMRLQESATIGGLYGWGGVASDAVSANTTYTASFIVQPDQRAQIYIQINDGVQGVNAIWTLTGAGSVVSAAGYGSSPFTGVSAAISPWTSGRYLVSLTFTTAATTASLVSQIYLIKSGASAYDGTAGEGLYIDAFQLEAGTFATSRIPTTTGPVTRAGDVIRYTYALGAEGAIYVEYMAGVGTRATSSFVLVANDGTNNERHAIYTTPTQNALIVTDGGATQANPTSGILVAGGTYRCMEAFRVNDFAFTDQGLSPQVDASGTLPTTSTIEFGSQNGATFLNGWLREVGISAVRPHNAILPERTRL